MSPKPDNVPPGPPGPGTQAASTHPVYADRMSLAAVVGNPSGQDDRLDIALVMASRWVDHRVGENVGSAAVPDDPVLPIDSTPIELPITVTVMPVRVEARNATLVAAARFLRSGDAPFSVLGGLGDLAVRVTADIPEADLQLIGIHKSWGIA